MSPWPRIGEADILVTGGAGFIGSALAQTFAKQGGRVLVLDDCSSGRPDSLQGVTGITVVRCDIRDARSVALILAKARPRIVYHLAALHYIPECNRRPLDTISINVTGTYSLLQAAAQAQTSRVVFASSAAVYAPMNEALSEDHPVGPIDTYGASKLYAEILCRDFAVATSIPTTTCRFFNVYGPNDTVPHLLPALVKQVLAGATELRVGNLAPRRDYIHINDLVAALLKLSEHSMAGYRTYNLGSGIDHSVQEIADLIVAIAGRPIPIVQEPARMRSVDRPRLLANIDRAREELGWEPRISVAAGLRTMLQPVPEASS